MREIDFLTEVNTRVNQTSYRAFGGRESCILSSFAVAYILMSKGYESFPIRVYASVFSKERNVTGVSLGGKGDGTRIPAAMEGMWNGHLAVFAKSRRGNKSYLLDPTLDQVNRKRIRVKPVVLEIPEMFLIARRGALYQIGNCNVRYSACPHQNGFMNKPDARPSHWFPIAERVLRQMEKVK